MPKLTSLEQKVLLQLRERSFISATARPSEHDMTLLRRLHEKGLVRLDEEAGTVQVMDGVPATAQQVREYYEAQGCDVSIHDSGSLNYFNHGSDVMVTGGHLSEYRVIDGKVVYAEPAYLPSCDDDDK